MNKICVIIPVFNNENTIKNVVSQARKYADDIIVINDGSTDKTPQILSEFDNICVHNFPKNKGKGAALRKGFEIALNLGFTHAITIDADGQHFCEWLEIAKNACQKEPEKLLVGARTGENIGEIAPKKNVFARNFGNTWIKNYTGFSLNDTQSGFRVYPLEKIKNIKFKTARFEFEQEVLVKSAHAGVELGEFTIPQYYQPQNERVSHYRVFRDSARISWFFTKTGFKKVRDVFIAELKSNISPKKAAASFSVGIFFGIFPIYGFQTAAVILAATLLKLNRPLAVLGSMISSPPIIPFIIFAAVWLGSAVFSVSADEMQNAKTLSALFFEDKSMFFVESGKFFMAGSVILAFIASILAFFITYPFCKIIKKKPAN
jgi:glycosyltransferase involved in cell wall biosynthesis